MFARRFVNIRRQAVKFSSTRTILFSINTMTSSAVASSNTHANNAKRKHPGGYRFKNKKQKKAAAADPKDGSHDSVLLQDVESMLQRLSVGREQGRDDTDTPALERDSELVLDVTELSSTGDGLGYHRESNHVLVVPYTAPGDKVRVKVNRLGGANHSFVDVVKVLDPAKVRSDDLVKCPYFTKCSGCQFQMLPYDYQLLHKRDVVIKAYRNFSGLRPEQISDVGDTIGSPLQYGYRTKLTPHFDGPPGKRSDRRNGIHHAFTEVPSIGFMQKGSRKTLDIEDCPIATDAVRKGNKRERKRVADELHTFKRGATLLLRENTKRVPKAEEGSTGSGKDQLESDMDDTVIDEHLNYTDIKSCITNSNAESTEYINDLVFTNRAGAFFQNNNSILPIFTQYIRDRVKGDPSKDPTDVSSSKLNFLIDAYCGSGLFSIVLASIFTKTLGIDIASSSIESASRNASLNNIPPDQASFICADATDLFSQAKFPPEETVVVIDPPRKGCDEDFLRQLANFGPQRVLYVSCNVHTQARDVGLLVKGMADGARYEIESLRGFDFFPQTGHVEGVAVLNRVQHIASSSA